MALNYLVDVLLCAGILSDSFFKKRPANYPCTAIEETTVLSEIQSGIGSDEGRAMVRAASTLPAEFVLPVDLALRLSRTSALLLMRSMLQVLQSCACQMDNPVHSNKPGCWVPSVIMLQPNQTSAASQDIP